MTFEQAKDYCKGQLQGYLESKGINTRENFKCLNPQHDDKKPSMGYDRAANKCHCFSCNASYDIFDLIGIDYNLNLSEAYKKAFELYNVKPEPAPGYRQTSQAPREPARAAEPPRNQGAAPAQTYEPKPEPDRKELTAAIEQAHAALLAYKPAMDYLFSRGLTLETIKAHKLGYSEQGQNALLKGYNTQFQAKSRKAGLYKYIYPIFNKSGECVYFISEISDRTQIDNYNGKYRKLSNTAQRLYNEDIIAYNSGVIFVCEGVFDALSIEQQGGQAIAINGISGGNRIKELESLAGTNNSYIIALDSDTAGSQGTAKLRAAINAMGRSCTIRPIPTEKDANDLLRANPAALAAYIEQATADALRARADFEQAKGIAETLLAEREQDPADAGTLAAEMLDREQESKDYPNITAGAQLQDFINNIQKSKYTKAHPTGFNSLDAAIDGGLYAGGLYFIGAVSSLGKTTLALQIADSIAAAGTDILFFSLEMARDEIIAKSISRHTLLEDRKLYGGQSNAKSTRGILSGSRWAYYTDDEKRVIKAAIDSYSQYANNIYISVGIGDIGIEQIRAAAEKHKRITGRIPVLVIDYLQILAPADPRYTDKQNTDKAVLELKRLARDLKTPVIGISSFNRDNYKEPVNLASFKESGAIEYSADVLIGLQLLGMDYQEGESDKARANRIKELTDEAIAAGKAGRSQTIQVKILKNRNGSKGQAILDFYPKYNYFCDSTSTPTEIEAAARTGGKLSRTKDLEKLIAAFKEVESPAESNTANLEDLADKLDLKKAALKARLKEYKKLFTISGETITYTPEPAEPATDPEPLEADPF